MPGFQYMASEMANFENFVGLNKNRIEVVVAIVELYSAMDRVRLHQFQ